LDIVGEKGNLDIGEEKGNLDIGGEKGNFVIGGRKRKLGMRNVPYKICAENQNTHFVFSDIFSKIV
jgi:hypothetical protein